MSGIGRFIALIGLIVVVAGVFMPAICSDAQCKIIDDALFDPARFDENTELGILGNLYGLLALVILVPTLFAIISGDRLAITVSALAATAMTVVLLAQSFIRVDDAAGLELSWGWAVLGVGCLVLIVSTLLKAAPKPLATVAAMPALAAQQRQFHKTVINVPGQAPAQSHKPPGIFKTMIDAGFGRRPAEPAPPPFQGGPNYGADAGRIDSSKKTMVEGMDMQAPLPPAIQGRYGMDAPDPMQATLPSVQSDLGPAVPSVPANMNFGDRTMIDQVAAPPPPPQPKIHRQTLTEKTMIDMGDVDTPAAAMRSEPTPQSGTARPEMPAPPAEAASSIPTAPPQAPAPSVPRRAPGGVSADLERTNIVPAAFDAGGSTQPMEPVERAVMEKVSDSGQFAKPTPPKPPVYDDDPSQRTYVQPDRPSQQAAAPLPATATPAQPAVDDPMFKTMITGPTAPSTPPAAPPQPPADDPMFKTMLQLPTAPPAQPTPPTPPPAPTQPPADDPMFATMLQLPTAPPAQPTPPTPPPASPEDNEAMFKTMVGINQRTPPPISKQHDLSQGPADEDEDDEDKK